MADIEEKDGAVEENTGASVDDLESSAPGGEDAFGANSAPESGGADAAPAGEIHTTKRGRSVPVLPYDFRRPIQLSKGFFRSLSMVSDTFAKTLALSLSNYLRVPVVVRPSGVRQIVFEEHTGAISNPSFINILDLSPIKIPGMLDMDLSLSFAMIEKLLGSHSINNDVRREFTTIELRIARRIVQRVLDELREAMKRIIEVKIELTGVEHNPDFSHIMSANDPCILIEFELELGEYKGPMSICISLGALDAEIGTSGLSPYRDMRNPRERQEDEIKLRRILASTSTELVVELGRRSISLDELRVLSEGEVLNLRRQIDAPLTVKVGGSEIFLGRMGRYKRKAAVKLLKILRPRDAQVLGQLKQS